MSTSSTAGEEPVLDVLLSGGRLVDPASGTDALRDVGVLDGTVVHVGTGRPAARTVVDVSGLVVAPGFIDLHSHAQSPTGLLLQAFDGVTTALDLESGTLPVAEQYRAAEREGRPVNFGFSASWAVARMHVMDGAPLPEVGDGGPMLTALEVFQRNQHLPGWSGLASDDQVDRILDLLEEGVHDGALGFGVLLGYSPASGRDEYFRVARRAQQLGVLVSTHARQMSNVEPGSSLDGALEVIAAAAGTGAAMHLCHINSTSLRRIDEVSAAVVTAQRAGNRVTTEAYPYTMSSTGIGAAFLAPERLHRMGITPADITYLPTGERVPDAATLARLRSDDPGGLCLIDHQKSHDSRDVEALVRALTMPGAVIASDAMPLVRGGRYDVLDEWPVPAGALTHPRSIGTFARTMRWLVRERGEMSLLEAVRRCSTAPAEIMAPSTPAMRRKGRLDVGADADLVVFDPERISDLAEGTAMTPSTGVVHLYVGGHPVISDGAAVPGARPGRAVRSGP
jgi:N-acyl-D-aspartate/D-glutamate deacylase